jgi:hypothetical protein
VAPLVERAGLVAAFDDAWLLIGGLVVLFAVVPARCDRRREDLESKIAENAMFSSSVVALPVDDRRVPRAEGQARRRT